MKKSIKFMSVALALAMCCSAMPTTAFAATSLENSVGSVAGDYVSVAETVGEDATQVKGSTAENYTQADGDTTQGVNVYATIASTYEVRIPKTIIIAADGKKGAYQVSAKGNIAGNEVLKIAPPESFGFKSGEEKATVTATIAQDVTEWEYAALATLEEDGVTVKGITQVGEISAPDITAGTWNGTFNFDISLTEKASQ